MAKDNEYITVEDLNQESKTKKSKKAKRKDTKNSTNQKKTPSLKSKINGFFNVNPANKNKFRRSFGSILLLLSCYLFLANLSFIFTWKSDQDLVMNNGLFDLLFNSKELVVENWLGKFGAWSSHLLIHRWFGLSSFGFCILLFVSGIKFLLDYAIFPIRKVYANTILFMVWGSIFFGYFSHQINYLGGTFGFHLNKWLSASFGRFGTFTFVLVSLYIIIVVLFNPNFLKFFKTFLNKKSDVEEISEISNENTNNSFTDIHVVNTIKDEQITQDEISEIISFDEDGEKEKNENDVVNSELVVTIKDDDKNRETTHQKEDLSEDFEVEFTNSEDIKTKEVENDNDKENELTIVENKADEILSDDEVNDLQKEFGDYDPTLELSDYILPAIDLLKDYGTNSVNINKQELEDNKNRIVETLQNYKIDIAKIKATVGPTVTLYEVVPAPGVRISKIKNLEDDIALSLSALGIRIIAPIPGKGTVGIEVPNSKPEMVPMRALIASEKFQNSDYELPVVLGKTITNETYMFDLTKMPHLLVAGATGQGKSVGLNAILVSILYKKHPAQVKFVLVDPKKVELTLFNKIERHFLAKLPGEGDAIITDTSKVVNTMNSLCIEMDDRYELLKEAHCRTIKEYNSKFIARKLNPEKGHRYLPYIVVLIDEFADLIMTAGKEIEHPIARIAQLARAIGIHLIVATQRPSVNVITGMIKANFPARIAFRVLSKIDSRTILDGSGADQLIGKGDMLMMTGSDLTRLQCGFVDTPEVEAICNFIGEQRAFPEALILPEYVGEGGDNDKDFDTNELDSMFADAARIVVLHQQGSASLLQRKLKLGYNRAGRIVDQLEAFGIIGPFQGSKAREVLYAEITTLDEYLATKNIF